MKALENKAEKYDKGIKTLTLGKYPKIKQYICDYYLKEGETLLDIGMGTGTFAIIAAKKRLKVTGIDSSEKMLNVAKKNINETDLMTHIDIKNVPVINLDVAFENSSFDKVSAMLIFSELYEKEQDFCLEQIYRILNEQGEFILLDEVKPKRLWKRIIYSFIKIPLKFITFLKSQLTTKALKKIEERLENKGFQIIDQKLYLLDSLKLIRAKKMKMS